MGRISVTDAKELVETLSWPTQNARLWQHPTLPTDDELRQFFVDSWTILHEIAPRYVPPNVQLPEGAADALAGPLSKQLAAIVSRRLAYPEARRTPIYYDEAGNLQGGTPIKTGRALREIPGGKDVQSDLEKALRFHLLKYEPGGSHALRQGADKLDELLARPDALRNERERELFELLQRRRAQPSKRRAPETTKSAPSRRCAS